MTDNLGFGRERRRGYNKEILDGTTTFRDGFREMLRSVSENGKTFDECKEILKKSERRVSVAPAWRPLGGGQAGMLGGDAGGERLLTRTCSFCSSSAPSRTNLSFPASLLPCRHVFFALSTSPTLSLLNLLFVCYTDIVLDPGFKEFFDWSKKANVPVVIVSS